MVHAVSVVHLLLLFVAYFGFVAHLDYFVVRGVSVAHFLAFFSSLSHKNLNNY